MQRTDLGAHFMRKEGAFAFDAITRWYNAGSRCFSGCVRR